MKKIALLAVSSFALALAACGDSGNASEDAMAENVELAADEAMADTPDPVPADAVATAAEEATQSAESALDAAEAAGVAAEEAAADAAAAAEAATAAAAAE